MVSESSELPFFPKYDTEYLYDDQMRVTWFESLFSQSHYNVYCRSNGSNACTLIAVLMASKCYQYNVAIKGPEKSFNIRLIHLLACSMLEGNKIHDELKTKKVLKHINLNVPEAIKYADKQAADLVEWKSLVYMESLSKSLFQNIKTNYMEWLKYADREDIRNSDINIILVADSRTVLFIVQEATETVTLIDSHQHTGDKGAFIAIANHVIFGRMCHWFKDVLKKCYDSDPQIYELSFLYFREK